MKQVGGSRKQSYQEHRLTKPLNEHLRERMRDPERAIGYLGETFKADMLTFEQAVRNLWEAFGIYPERESEAVRLARWIVRNGSHPNTCPKNWDNDEDWGECTCNLGIMLKLAEKVVKENG